MAEKLSNPLDEADIKVMMTYGRSPYAQKLAEAEGEIKKLVEDIDEDKGKADAL